MTEKTKKWTDEAIATLTGVVGSESPVSVATIEKAAETLGFSARSVASKLRTMEYVVASMAKEKVSAFSEGETISLISFVNSNAGNYTYKEIAEAFEDGKFNAKQIQGKILALELTGAVKATEKAEVQRTYTEAEETKFVSMVEAGNFIEEIATTLGKSLPSARGKALSLLRSGLITKIPAQKESHAKDVVDAVETLGKALAGMTVDEIAKAVDKTSRGIKTLLTRRGIDCADYKGSEKKAKAEAKEAKAA